jgi:hypothetical protein
MLGVTVVAGVATWWARGGREVVALRVVVAHSLGSRGVGVADKVTVSVDVSQALTLQGLDRNQNVVSVQGTPVWTLSDPAAGTLAPNSDGLGAVFVGKRPGTATIQVSLDRPGGDPLKGSFTVEVVSGVVASLAIVPGPTQPL